MKEGNGRAALNDEIGVSNGGVNLKEFLVPAFNALKQIVELPKPHLLALHLWIHVVEQSSQPTQGEAAADTLAKAIGTDGSTHLIHMPGHIYFRTGRYQDCIQSSLAAIAQDAIYSKKCLVPYLPTHNQAMLVACSLLAGNLGLTQDVSPPLYRLILTLIPIPNHPYTNF